MAQKIISILVVSLWMAGALHAQNLLLQGEFGSSSIKEDWQATPDSDIDVFRVLKEGSTHYLTVQSDSDCSLSTRLAIPSVDNLHLTVSMRGRGHRGEFYNENDRPRVVFQQLDVRDNAIGIPAIIPFSAFIGWAEQYDVMPVHEQATDLSVTIEYRGNGPAHIRLIEVKALNNDVPEWKQKAAFVPAGAQYCHPLPRYPLALPHMEERARPVGAAVSEDKITHVINVQNKGNAESLYVAFDSAIQLINNGEHVKLLIESGTYRLNKPLQITNLSDKGRDAILVIEGMGDVQIKGSFTEGWEPSEWKLVDAQKRIYKRNWPYNWGLVSSGYYSPGNIICHRREQVFLNGKRLNPFILEKYIYSDTRGRKYNAVGLVIEEGVVDEGRGQRNILPTGYKYNGLEDIDQLPKGSFGVYEIGAGEEHYRGNSLANSILVRLPDAVENMKDAKIEVSLTPALLEVKGKNNLVLRNLKFMHSNAHYNNDTDKAMVSIEDDRERMISDVVIENCFFNASNGMGLLIHWAKNVTLRRCVINDNGNYGLRICNMYNLLAEDVEVSYNNQLGKLGNYVVHQCGGINFYGERCHFINVRANDNFGFGFRGDIWGIDLLFDGCAFDGNSSHGGMFHEIEWGPIIVKNTSIKNNAGVGVRLLSTRNVAFDHCEITDNEEVQIELHSMPGRVAPRATFERNMFFVHYNQGLTISNTTIGTSLQGSGIFGYKGNLDAYTQTLLSEYNGINNHFYYPDVQLPFQKVFFGIKDNSIIQLNGWKEWIGTHSMGKDQ